MGKKIKKSIKAHQPDKTLIIILVCIIGMGLLILASASTEVSREHYGKPYHYFFHQLFYGVGIGLLFLFVVSKINYRFWKKWALVIFIVAVFCLVLIFIPGLGFGYGGAKRWVDLRIFTFQPSEALKLGLIIYLAAWLERKGSEIKTFSYGTLPFLLILTIVEALVIAQPDIGTLGTVVAIAITIFFLSGARFIHILGIVLAGLTALFTLIKLAPYRMNRLLVFLKPEIDPLGIGYQTRQALLTVGSGGLFGLGWGHSRQKYNYLPSPASDSVFAITAEELGFLGAVILIMLFVGLAMRGFRIAKNSPDKFAGLAAAGITSWFIIQAFVNIGAIIGLIPLTGITLPFISYGASSMIMSLAGVGILINISKYTKT